MIKHIFFLSFSFFVHFTLVNCYYSPIIQYLLNKPVKEDNRFPFLLLAQIASLSGTDTVPPTDLNYTPLQFLNGVEGSFTPTFTGTVRNFAISPDLPTGIQINSSGIISGTYSQQFGLNGSFTVTASNTLGDTKKDITIQFFGKPPYKTNQTTCYDTSGTLDSTCTLITSIGQDGALQKGIAANFLGPTLVGSDYITTDQNTGLTWNSCLQGTSGATCSVGIYASTLTWSLATSNCSSLDLDNSGTGFASLKNWRLPTPEELDTLVNFNLSNPSIYNANFPNTNVGVGWHWTSLDNPADSTNAWWIYFRNGEMGPARLKSETSDNFARCVTGTSTYLPPQNLLIDNGDGTVTDLNHSLVWQKCTRGTDSTTCANSPTLLSWADALSYCNSLSLGKYSWRLPNINEAKKILNRRTSVYPAIIDSTVFPSNPNSEFWTSSTDLGNPGTNAAWVIFFNAATVFPVSKNLTRAVRCVASP
ncbi:MAG: DUF1566 domain-containing protein [Leptospira sp.]|nr:DUF1566 domain-containing protein [Leptospira sp.]